MSLQSLVFCRDEKIVRVLRRVLSDLEISLEHCPDADAIIRKLTRKRYEAVIVDCADTEQAAQILKSVRSAPCNKHAVAVALVEEQTGLRSVFDLGAHFVLYKPISSERAKSSFRAARALMKRERRRHERILVQVPVTVITAKGKHIKTTTVDLGEGGMALQLSEHLSHATALHLQFSIPDSEYKVDCTAEVAWENAAEQAGLRFRDVEPETHKKLLAWIASHSADLDRDDPPIQCKLTDLSLGGCYLETSAPFPQRTRVTLSMRVGLLQVEAEGVVRVLHPEIGMGVEFTQGTAEERQQVEKFIHALMNSNGVLPDLMVDPQGIEPGEPQTAMSTQEEGDDPLVFLFHHKAELPAEAFHAELKRQRSGPVEVGASA